MGAGDFPDRIEFQPKIETPNVLGQVIISWGESFELWGKAVRNSEQNATFTIRCNQLINTGTHRILRWNAYWTINSAIHVFDIREDKTTLQSDFSSLVETTTLQSTKREYVDGIQIVRPPQQ